MNRPDGRIQYMIVSGNIEVCLGSCQVQEVKIFVCLNLVDHLCFGIGLTRESAINEMVDKMDAKYGNINEKLELN
jgi:hypothetical protein